jgi:hypothetical protein
MLQTPALVWTYGDNVIMESKPERYIEHKGTVRVSGRTLPKTAGCRAFSYFQQGYDVIDFFYIGANAGHQAVKAMTVFSHIVKNEKPNIKVTFEPLRILTLTNDESGNQKEKDATVWRAVFVEN